MVKNSLADKLIKASKNSYAGSIDVCEIYKPGGFYDTGNYMMNAVLSGSVMKGLRSGWILQLAGEKSTGKSLICLNILINHVKSGKKNYSILFETEGALMAENIQEQLTPEERSRFLLFPCFSVENTQEQMANMLDTIMADEDKDIKYIWAIDSLGMLPSEKEIDNSKKENAPKDMTKAQSTKSLFRTSVMKLAVLKIPLILVNHTYATMSQYIPDEVSGGSGPAFANSITLILSKKKLRDKDKIQVGAVFTVTPRKSRVVAENISSIEIYSRFDTGITKYAGLFEFLKNVGKIKAVGNGSKGGSTFTFVDTNESFTSGDFAKMKPSEFWNKKRLEYVDKVFQDLYLLKTAKDRGLDEVFEEAEA